MNYKLWIDGAWADSQQGSLMQIENPANGSVIAEVVNGSHADVDAAVKAAQRAFYDGRWSRLTPGQRSQMLWRLNIIGIQKLSNKKSRPMWITKKHGYGGKNKKPLITPEPFFQI